MENCFSIDFLTINVKNITSEKLLSLFCSSIQNNEIIIDNFVHRDFGGLRGYSKSYAFLDENFIRLSYHPEHPDFGVSIQLTGQGCKFLKSEDFIRLIQNIRKENKPYSVTRLDIAYDDFNRVLPLEKMYESVYNFQRDNKSIATKIMHESVQFYGGFYNGLEYKNFEIGTRTSTGRVRLYDKRAEKKVDEMDYWYRLELELRQNKAQAFVDLYVDGYSLNDLYITALTSIIRFIDDIYKTRGDCPNADWFDKLLVEFGNSSSKTIFREVLNSLKKKVYPTNIVELLSKKASHLFHQYGNLITLLEMIFPDGFRKFAFENLTDMQLKAKYRAIYEFYFKNGYCPDGFFEVKDSSFAF